MDVNRNCVATPFWSVFTYTSITLLLLWPARLNIGAMTDGYPDVDPRSLGYSYIAKPQLY